MKFLWPQALWLLLALPALAMAGAQLVRTRLRRIDPAARALVKSTQPPGMGRYLPMLLLACALALLLAAVARPSIVVPLPTARPTVILALDVSGSMQAADIPPTRLRAAQAAARAFARALPPEARIGLVEFTDGAMLIQRPSTDRGALMAAIDTLRPQMGTAIGLGIVESLQALFPEERMAGWEAGASAGASAAPARRPRPAEPDASVAIVLLTDGQNTEGPPPAEAAALAAQRGVRVYTVGIGTPSGLIHRGETSMLPVGIDEDALRTIAKLTRAEYFNARTAPDLSRIYSALGAKLALEKNAVEISALFCALGALALCAGAGLSVARHGRIV